MAITQISQITVRKGLQQDLPQLAGGEFGWAVDTGLLYIGNGTLAEGAPAIGLTQVITNTSTQFNQITSFTYEGQAQEQWASAHGQMFSIPSGDAQTRSIQNKLEDIVSVKDFGAAGDGVTDDTESIQIALRDLYQDSTSPASQNIAARKALYFPAGQYVVSSTLTLPGNCTIFGEGLDHTAILSNGINLILANTQVDIAAATLPIVSGIEIHDITLQGSSQSNTILQLDKVQNLRFNNVRFFANSIQSGLFVTACIGLGAILNDSDPQPNENLSFVDCEFNGADFGIRNLGFEEVNKLNVQGSLFTNLNRGIQVNYVSNPSISTYLQINNNLFENINYEAIRTELGTGDSLTSVNNIFINCGQRPIPGGTAGSSPINAVVWSGGTNFSSSSDLFSRSDYNTLATTPNSNARIIVNNQQAIFADNTRSLNLGLKSFSSATTLEISTTPGANLGIISLADYGDSYGYVVDYVMNSRGTSSSIGRRKGKLEVAINNPDVTYTDDYTENGSIDVTTTVSQSGVVTFTALATYPAVSFVDVRYSVEAIQNNN